MRALYTVQELANALRLQPGTVRNKLSRREDLPRSVRVGRRRLFSEEDVERWLQEQFGSGETAARIEEVPERCLKGPGRPRRPPAAPTMLPARRRPMRRAGAHRKEGARQFGLFTEESE
jgi:excisionase family DNA binding protein